MTKKQKKALPRNLGWLLAHVDYESDECLDWPYGSSAVGYGRVRHENETRNTHLVMCLLAHGPKPTFFHEAAHSCGRRICVNPNHLSWKTSEENQADKIAHGTLLHGDTHPHVKLKKEDAIFIANSKGKIPQDDLAARFGVSQVTISNIQTGYSWSRVTGVQGVSQRAAKSKRKSASKMRKSYPKRVPGVAASGAVKQRKR